MSEKQFNELYGEYLERMSTAPDNVKTTYSDLGTALENYMIALQEHTFRDAFLMGYEKGMAAVQEQEKRQSLSA